MEDPPSVLSQYVIVARELIKMRKQSRHALENNVQAIVYKLSNVMVVLGQKWGFIDLDRDPAKLVKLIQVCPDTSIISYIRKECLAG